MSLASYKTVLQSVIESQTVSGREFHSDGPETLKLIIRILPDYIVGPPNLRVLLTVNRVAAELLRLVCTSQSDTMELTGEGTYRSRLTLTAVFK